MKGLLTLTLCLFCSVALYGQSCTDTAYKLRFSGPDSLFTVHHITTADQGALVLAEVYRYPLKKVLLFRLDKDGALQWSRELADAAGLLLPSRVLELSGGDIAVAGISRQGRNAPQRIFLARLDASGRLLAQRLYASVSNHPLYIQSLCEGANGDVLLGWKRVMVNYGIGEDNGSGMVVRINAAGELVWSKEFRVSDQGDVHLAGVFWRSGTLMLAGYTHDSRMACANRGVGAFFIQQLDYATGIPQQLRTYCFQHGGSGFGYGYTDINFSATLLSDGHLALLGSFHRNNDSTHFYKVLFDDSGYPSGAGLYAVPYNGYNTHIQVLPSGLTGIVALDNGAGVGYRATIDASETILRQRRFPYYAAAPPNDFYYHDSYAFTTFRWAERKDRGFTLANNHTGSEGAVIEFSRLTADTDTLTCLGADHAFLSVFPFAVSAFDWTWQSVVDNSVGAFPLSLTAAAYPLQGDTLCQAVNTCSSLVVRGAESFCAGENEVEYLGVRNPGCRQKVVWELYPATAGAVLESPNDSSARLRCSQPLDKPVTFSLIASLADCPLTRDTMALTALPAMRPLPPDTTLCAGTALTLSPGEGFAWYRWQDGNTGARYTVTASGTYWVEVAAAAGCRRRDTVSITMAPLPSGFLHDTTKCADLPVSLSARGVYTSYLWSDGSTQPTLQVERAGRYSLRVTDSNGCTGEDTVRIDEMECPRQVYFPTAFTPNQDGRNDTYRPLILSPLQQYRFEVFNRWGQRVFRTTLPGQGWDGRLATTLQPSGLYTWVCTYQFAGTFPVQARGSFLLLR